MKLIHKFFLAFFITNIALVGLMFVFIYLNFSSGFNDFVEQEEQKHVASVKQQLSKLYSEKNSWQLITDNTRLWRSIVEPQKKAVKPELPPVRGNEKQEKPKSSTSLWINLPADLLKTGQRISLYDQNKKVIVGKTTMNDNPHIEAILLQNKVIGWIGLVPSRLVENSPATAFLTAQFHNYFMITLLVILLAFIMAIVLSKHLIKPIKQLVKGTSELNRGNFSSRIKPLTQDELGTLSINFNELAYTLEQNQEMRSQWVSDTSHELKTPLTVLRSHLLAIQDGVFVADAERIKLLINQVENLHHIVEDLAQLANNDMTGLTYDNSDIDIIDVFKHTIESYSARFTEQKLSVNTNALPRAGKYIVKGDKDRLQQLFANLLENTCRYTNQGGQINIDVNQSKHQIEILLQDSAPGVSLNDQEKLFDRFYRVEKSRNREHGGSGLGLSLCKQIVEAHGGDISLQSSLLGGLEIKIIFPRVG